VHKKLKMKSPEEVYISFLLGSITGQEIIDWATENYNLNVEPALRDSIFEIASLSKRIEEEINEAENLLKQLIEKHFPAFEKHKELLAIELLRIKCQMLLEGKIKPYELCRLIVPIEQEFNFPKWLGNLYNVCDWCEPETEPDIFLINEVKVRNQDLINILNKEELRTTTKTKAH
jgi:hypothetical protein